jgi:pSer/pThr/pTyr-binding forkhead associated (FHA) protein
MHYGFRLGNSEVVLLDAIAFVGRKPSRPRVVRGGASRLVRVLSPSNEVSATHVEIRQVGATVVVSDLHSTNGTVVGVPGSPVRTLRPGDTAVVTVGTLIDIGDGNVIEILPVRVDS